MEGLPDLETARKDCGAWEDDECEDNYPEECPFHEECKKDVESDAE